MTHTPGPWKIRATPSGYAFSLDLEDAKGEGIGFFAYGTDAEAHANARLIAAAPEMLDTLREIAEDLEGGSYAETQLALKRARAVLARLEG